MNKKENIEQFFALARARHSIYLKRRAGLPYPWTTDTIMQKYRFCNLFRELDKTTVWFREHVRDPLRNKPEALLATVTFRLLNRITTGEAIFLQTELTIKGELKTAFEQFVEDGDTAHLERAARAYMPNGPYVTGAYFMASPNGVGDKLKGMLSIIGNFYKARLKLGSTNYYSWYEFATECKEDSIITLRDVWVALQVVPHIGPFHSYEIVTDLRYTGLLDDASDINTWANAGPGAQRGLNRIHGRDIKVRVKEPQAVEEMQELLALSREERFWPRAWPAWEMREPEMWLCETDKYLRIKNGEGRMKGVFRP